jgi:hypothetical protein
MTRTLEATFDGKVLRPDKPLNLEPNTRVRVTIETREKPKTARGSLRELFGSVDLGHPIGIDNDGIDADLAREYANLHEDGR